MNIIPSHIKHKKIYIKKQLVKDYKIKIKKLSIEMNEPHNLITVYIVCKNGKMYYCYFRQSSTPMTIQEVDEIIMKKRSCLSVSCLDCPYKRNGKRNDGLFCDIYSINDDAYIHKNKSYDYVLNKRKIERLKEILDCFED